MITKFCQLFSVCLFFILSSYAHAQNKIIHSIFEPRSQKAYVAALQANKAPCANTDPLAINFGNPCKVFTATLTHNGQSKFITFVGGESWYKTSPSTSCTQIHNPQDWSDETGENSITICIPRENYPTFTGLTTCGVSDGTSGGVTTMKTTTGTCNTPRTKTNFLYSFDYVRAVLRAGALAAQNEVNEN